CSSSQGIGATNVPHRPSYGARREAGKPPESGDDGMTSELRALLSALVAVDSVNPSLVAGGAGEHRIATLVEAWARAAGLDAERLEATPGRPSVLVRARGTGGGRTLLLCGHLDTV